MFDAVVKCTGLDDRLDNASLPVFRDLLARSSVRTAGSGIGVDVNAASAALDRDGRPVPGLFAIGPLTRGALGETAGALFIVRQVSVLIPALFAPLAGNNSPAPEQVA